MKLMKRILLIFFFLILASCFLKKGKVNPLTQAKLIDEDFEELKAFKDVCDLGSFRMENLGSFGLRKYEDSMGLMDSNPGGDLRVFEQDFSFSFRCKDPKVVDYLFAHYKVNVLPQPDENYSVERKKNEDLIASVKTLGRNFLLNKKYYKNFSNTKQIDHKDNKNFKSGKMAVDSHERLPQTKFLSFKEKKPGSLIALNVERKYNLKILIQGFVVAGVASYTLLDTSTSKGVLVIEKGLKDNKPDEKKFSLSFNTKGDVISDQGATRKINEELTVVHKTKAAGNNLVFHVKKKDVALKLWTPLTENEYVEVSRAVTLKALYTDALSHLTYFYDGVIRAKSPKGERRMGLKKVSKFLAKYLGKSVLKLKEKKKTRKVIELRLKKNNIMEFVYPVPSPGTEARESDIFKTEYSIADTSFNSSEKSFNMEFFHVNKPGLELGELLGLDLRTNPSSHRRRVKLDGHSFFIEFDVKMPRKSLIGQWKIRKKWLKIDLDED